MSNKAFFYIYRLSYINFFIYKICYFINTYHQQHLRNEQRYIILLHTLTQTIYWWNGYGHARDKVLFGFIRSINTWCAFTPNGNKSGQLRRLITIRIFLIVHHDYMPLYQPDIISHFAQLVLRPTP